MNVRELVSIPACFKPTTARNAMEKERSKVNKDEGVKRLSRWGTGLSLACGVHCLAMPLLIAIIPAIGFSFLVHGWFEVLMLVLSVVISSCGFCWGFKKHRKIDPVFF